MHDPGWEIWTCSLLPMPQFGLPRPPDRHYELHRPGELGAWEQMTPEQRQQQVANYVGFLEQASFPVYTQGVWENLPTGVPYPLDDILKAFPRRYFTSTIAYMIAHALLEGVKQIGLWGVDMALQSERYSHQRACLEYLCGVCDGAGIQVYIPDECDLLKAAMLYGFGQESALAKRLAARKAHIAQQKRQIQQQIGHLQAQIHQANMALAGYSGVEDDLDWVRENWTNGEVPWLTPEEAAAPPVNGAPGPG